jgi:hypothetical protein
MEPWMRVELANAHRKAVKRLLLILAAAIFIIAGIAIRPPGAIRPWDIDVAFAPDGDPIAAASFNFGRLNPIGRWLILSYSVDGAGQWPEPTAVNCGPAKWVTARTVFGITFARGLVHCGGKQVIWT